MGTYHQKTNASQKFSPMKRFKKHRNGAVETACYCSKARILFYKAALGNFGQPRQNARAAQQIAVPAAVLIKR